MKKGIWVKHPFVGIRVAQLIFRDEAGAPSVFSWRGNRWRQLSARAGAAVLKSKE